MMRPNEHQKFTDWVDQKMGAPQFNGKLTFDLDLISGEGQNPILALCLTNSYDDQEVVSTT